MINLQWTDRHPMPLPVAGGAAAFLGNRLVYAGGSAWIDGVKRWLKDVQVYDSATDRWAAGPPLPRPLAYGACVRYGKAMEVLGGSDGEKTHRECWRLEEGAQQWQPSGVAPSDTLFGRAESFGGRTYLFGGCADVADLTKCTDAVHVREAKGAWRPISRLPQGAVAMPAEAPAHGRMYFFGGCSMPRADALKNRDDAYSFDPATSQWKRLRPLPRANRGLTATVVDDRYILLYGGYTATQEEAAVKEPGFGFSATVLVYDIQADSYREAGSGPLAAAGTEVLSHAGVIFAVGGEPRMRARSDRLMTAVVRHQKSEGK